MSENDKQSISILFAGDYCPVFSTVEEYSEHGIVIHDDVKDLFHAVDYRVLNLEAPVTANGRKIQKLGKNYRLFPEQLCDLKELRIDSACLANNHIRDYGNEGVADTLRILDEHQINHVGAGTTLQNARQLLVEEIKGKRIAFINMAEIEFSIATENRGGANPHGMVAAIRAIELAKSKADFVIMILHGGLEYVHVPSPESVEIMRFLADQGVTALIRHHPHYVQGDEEWKGVPIFYSIGNFCGNIQQWHKIGNRQGMIVVLTISNEGVVAVERKGVLLEDGIGKTRMMSSGEEAEWFAELNRYSASLSDETRLQMEWEKTVKEKGDEIISRMLLPLFMVRLLRRCGLLRFVKILIQNKLLWKNFFQNNAYRELILSAMASANDDEST